MLIFEIIVILLFIVFTYLGFKYGEDLPLWTILAWLFWIGIFFGILPGATQLNGEDNKYIKIVSLERGQEINGSFVLGMGKIETDNVYFAYKKVGENQYKLETLPDVIITETDTHEPAYSKITKCERPYLFLYCKQIENTIYVPKNTIKKKFDL